MRRCSPPATTVTRRWTRTPNRRDPDRLPGLEPVGDSRRRHLGGHRLAQPAAVPDRLGHEPVDAVGRRHRVGAAGLLYGSGGGFSKLFPRPDTSAASCRRARRPVVRCPTWRWTATRRRACWSARPSSSRTGVRYGEYRIGGTSLSSPLMAGVQALTQQRAGGRQGFLNPGIYAAARRSPEQFIDIAGPAPDAGNVRADYVTGSTPRTASPTPCGRSTRTPASRSGAAGTT